MNTKLKLWKNQEIEKWVKKRGTKERVRTPAEAGYVGTGEINRPITGKN